METPSSLFLLLFLLLITIAPFANSSLPDRYLNKPSSSSSKPPSYKQVFELIHPLPSDHLAPSCSLHVVHHTFAHTLNHPPYSVPYSPPPKCSSPWPHIALEFRANSIGNQYDRISGLWLGGVELLRTSTAEPTDDGIQWSFRKDITRYSSLLKQRNLNFTIMLENIVDAVYTAAFHVDVTILFYKHNTISRSFQNNQLLGLSNNDTYPMPNKAEAVYDTPSDLILPISSFRNDRGHWFKIEDESDVHYKKIRFPRNTRKVVLELYVSFHGNDEFWYSNPPNAYIRMNNLTTLRGNGAFREVFVTIDGMFVDSEVPFPVIFAGGINPLFWDPTVAIGAFDLPTYDFDLTPYLGILLDGKDHVIGIGVGASISYWLVDANLHIWLDKGAASVKAKSVMYQNPGSSVKRQESFKMLDGSFAIKGKRTTKLVGWVKSRLGNLTISVSHDYKFRNSIRFTKNGAHKLVTQSMKSSKDFQVMNEKGLLLSRVTVQRTYPLKVITWKLPGPKGGMYRLITNVSHSLVDTVRSGGVSSSVNNQQVANGWMDVKGNYVVSGKAITNQTLTLMDDTCCYFRTADAVDGGLVRDNSTIACHSSI